MNHKKLIPMYAILLGSVIVLGGCSNNMGGPGGNGPRGNRPENFSGEIPTPPNRNQNRNGQQQNNQQQTPTVEQAPTNETTTGSETVSSAEQIKKLTINQNCVGCGKCARIASSNFAMQGGRATVISQEKTDSTAVQHAIQACHSSAISLS